MPSEVMARRAGRIGLRNVKGACDPVTRPYPARPPGHHFATALAITADSGEQHPDGSVGRQLVRFVERLGAQNHRACGQVDRIGAKVDDAREGAIALTRAGARIGDHFGVVGVEIGAG